MRDYEREAVVLIEYALNLKIRFPDLTPFGRMLKVREELGRPLKVAALMVYMKEDELIKYLKENQDG